MDAQVQIPKEVVEKIEYGIRAGNDIEIKEALEQWLGIKLELIDVEKLAKKYEDRVVWELEWISKYQKGWKRKVIVWEKKEVMDDIEYLDYRLGLGIQQDIENRNYTLLYQNVEDADEEQILEIGMYYEIYKFENYIVVYVEYETKYEDGYPAGWETYHLVFKVLS